MTPVPHTLQDELDAIRAAFVAKVPAEIREAMERADLDLAGSGIAAHALKAGDIAPDFTLADAHGGSANLAVLVQKGPVVLSFFRGGWCPYCKGELRALQDALAAFAAHGATLLAISPQTRERNRATVEENGLGFAVLADVEGAVAQSYGLAFDLAADLRPIFTRFGHALPEINGSDRWLLPLPATYVIDRDRRIALASVDTDYRNRLEPATIVSALDCLNRRRSRCTP